jgi:hypothetical protein
MPVAVQKRYTLARTVPAIQVVRAVGADQPRPGLITQLPQGAELEVGGPGFNDRTVQVKCSGSSYFVFLEDLEPQRKVVSSASAA